MSGQAGSVGECCECRISLRLFRRRDDGGGLPIAIARAGPAVTLC